MYKIIDLTTLNSIKKVPNYLEINDLKKRVKRVTNKNVRLQQIVKQQKRELSEMAEINAKFLLIIGHDLRNPLSAILGVLELLRDSDTNDIDEYIDIASNSALRTLNLSNNLVTWASSQHKKNKLKLTEINLNELLIDEVANALESAHQKQISLSHKSIPSVVVKADTEMVKTVLRNLISNAIKYTPSGGNVTVSASLTKRTVKIVVKDTGIGVTPAARKKLMRKDTFFSTPGTMNEAGTGLGLLICKDFVEIHGGKISVSSKPGQGSTFQFTLPLSVQ